MTVNYSAYDGIISIHFAAGYGPSLVLSDTEGRQVRAKKQASLLHVWEHLLYLGERSVPALDSGGYPLGQATC